MGSLVYEGSESIYYPSYNRDSHEYDEDIDVGYMRQPIDEETWFVGRDINYRDIEEGVGHGNIPDIELGLHRWQLDRTIATLDRMPPPTTAAIPPPPAPTAAATPPPPAPMSLSCSPDVRYDSMELIADDNDESVKVSPNIAIDRLPNRDQVGVEEVLLDEEEKDGYLKASSLSPSCMKIQKLRFRARCEAIECIQIGPDICEKIYSCAVIAMVIYCRRLRKLHILSIQEVDAGAIDALAKHCQIWTDIGFLDCRKVDENFLGYVVSLSTSRLCAKQRSCEFDTLENFGRDGKKIEAFIESKTEDPNVGSGFVVTSGIMSANAKMCQRRAWRPYASANFSYLSLLEPTSLKGWDSDVMLSVLIPWILATHDDLVVSLTFIGGLSRNFSTNLRQIPSVTFWVASVLVGILLGKSWFTYATSIGKGIDESFVIHGGLLVVMVHFVITKVDEELLQSFVVIAIGAFCAVVRSTSHAHVAANFLYEWDLSQQISKLQAPISGVLLHIHRDYASVNFCNTFHEVAAAGANLEYNGLKGEIGYRVHDPGLAMATMENVEQQWRTLTNPLIVGKNDSENQMVAASIFLTSDDKVEAPLVDILGRISEFGVPAEGLINPQLPFIVPALCKGTTSVDQLMNTWKENRIILVTAYTTLRLRKQEPKSDAEAVVQILNCVVYQLVAAGHNNGARGTKRYNFGTIATTSNIEAMYRISSLRNDNKEAGCAFGNFVEASIGGEQVFVSVRGEYEYVGILHSYYKFHLEDKVVFKDGGVDTSTSSEISPISY